ncbi:MULTISPECIES: permease [unclassified Ornithinimicrobium]|uniref:permease n=1 Tax=unclassified Ornithinimicrobium TaxID=2615080 RepID=UPI00385298E3
MPSFIIDLLLRVLERVVSTVEHTWPYLLISIVLAAAIQVYVGTDRLARWMRRSTPVAVLGAVALGALTPFCSCGTMAVILGSLAASVPWAPVVAFMVSSPLTSPGEYVLSLGLFGAGFATTFLVAAIGVGLLGGAAAWALERTGWLAGQARISAPPAAVPCCAAELVGVGVPAGGVDLPPGADLPAGHPDEAAPTTSCCSEARSPHRQFLSAILDNGRRLATFFLAFAFLGYLLIELVPSSVFEQHLGDGNALTAVPLAALLGIPVYLNSDASLPLVASLMDGGMGAGPALAFLVTGAGTSVGAISGMLLVARWRVVALVVVTLLLSACLVGWLAPLWLT